MLFASVGRVVVLRLHVPFSYARTLTKQSETISRNTSIDARPKCRCEYMNAPIDIGEYEWIKGQSI